MEDKYFKIGEPKDRLEILKKRILNNEGDKEFFLKVFKNEAYLDFKLMAIRGYAKFADEQEVDPLMNKLTKLLIKRGKSLPYNYSELECMKSDFLIGHLLSTYNYNSIIGFSDQLSLQYASLPNELKNLFTLDENGEFKYLMPKEEVKDRVDRYFTSLKNKYL